jgi:hypothetical protein
MNLPLHILQYFELDPQQNLDTLEKRNTEIKIQILKDILPEHIVEVDFYNITNFYSFIHFF